MERILHIVSNISIRNGIMSVIMSYYRCIDRNRYNFDFLYFDERDVTYRKEIEKLGGKVYKVNRTKDPLKLFVEINQFVKKNIDKYKIIHLHEIFLIGALIGIKKKNEAIKIISHGHVTKFSSRKLASIRNRIMSIPNKFIPDYYFACSKDAGKVCFGRKFTKRGYVINNAINLSKFQTDKEAREKLREELKVTDKYVIGHVGNFTKQKNHFFLIDIFYEVQKKREDAVLILVGDGELRESVLEKCKELKIDDKVIYLGTRNDIDKVMNSFDCFVLPSIYEGLGIVLIEAQAIGLPCVFSDVVPKEANILTKNNEIVSLNKSPEIWADKILKCNKASEENITIEIQKAGYDIKIENQKLEKLYKNMIK